jgi:hypothetical protein
MADNAGPRDRCFIARSLRQLERFGDDRLCLVEASDQIQDTPKVGQDRHAGRVIWLEQGGGTTVQVDHGRDVGSLESPSAGGNQPQCCTAGQLTCPFVDRRQLGAVAEGLLKVVADDLLGLGSAVAEGPV